MVNKGLRCLKKDKCLKFENFERKIKSPFVINADFESILVPENNEKQNPKESDTSKYQNTVFEVMIINQYMLMKTVANLLSLT